MDTADTSKGKRNDTATPQDTAYIDKDKQVSDTKQEKRKEEDVQVDTNPTEAQKEAGNYKKGHLSIDGYRITIENPKGSLRTGKDKNGNKWETEMHNSYGYIRGIESVDGDHIDIFLSDNPTEGNVFVVDQVKEDRSFDEHKVMYGFNSIEEAKEAYLSNYTKGWKGLGSITEVSKEDFKKWIGSSKRKTKPFAEYKSVNKELNTGKEDDNSKNLKEEQKNALKKIKEFQKHNPNASEIYFVDSHGLPDAVKNNPDFSENWVAVYYNGTVFLNKANVTTEEQAVSVWVHEIGIHGGIRELIHDKKTRNGLMVRIYESAKEIAKTNKEYANILAHIEKNYTGKEVWGEEFLAYLSEKLISEKDLSETDRTILQKIINLVRGLLSDIYGLNTTLLTEKQIQDIIKASVSSSLKGNSKNEEEVHFKQLTEEEEIKSKAKANGTFMKAPNGKPSNLNERQWVQVRTKAFKKWFGDWELVNIYKMLDKGGINDVSLQAIDNYINKIYDDLRRRNELVVLERFSHEEQQGWAKGGEIYAGASIISGREDSSNRAIEETQDERNDRQESEIEAYAKAKGVWIENTDKTLRGEYINKNTGKHILLGKNAIKEVLQHDYKNIEQLQSIAAIPQIIKQSIYLDSAKNNDTKIDAKEFDYYVTGLKIDEIDYTVRSVIVTLKDDTRYYDHKLTQIEKGKLIDSLIRITNPGFNQTATLLDIKDTKFVSILQNNASMVVDENGEPFWNSLD